MKVSDILGKMELNNKNINRAREFRVMVCSAINESEEHSKEHGDKYDVIRVSFTLKELDELNEIIKEYIFLCDNENKRLGELEVK